MLKFKQFTHAGEEFDEMKTIEGSTRYYITPIGNLPSMTSLLKLLDDGGIDKWRKRIGEEEAEKVVKRSSHRGNQLHDYSEKYLNNELIRSEMTGEGRLLFNRAKPLLDQIELVVALEVPLYSSKYGYAGRVDCVCLLDDQITILDHKNSKKPFNDNLSWSRRKKFKYMLQCYGYAQALYEMKGYMATQGCLVVASYETMNAETIKFDLEPLKEEFELLVHAYHNDGEGIEKSLYYQI